MLSLSHTKTQAQTSTDKHRHSLHQLFHYSLGERCYRGLLADTLFNSPVVAKRLRSHTHATGVAGNACGAVGTAGMGVGVGVGVGVGMGFGMGLGSGGCAATGSSLESLHEDEEQVCNKLPFRHV